MEKIIKIVYLLVLVFSIILAVVSMVKAIRKKKQAGEELKFRDIIDILYSNMLEYIPVAEKAFAAYKGNPNADTSGMKLNDVLNKLRSDCSAFGIRFNESYWSNEIKNIIDLTKKVNVK